MSQEISGEKSQVPVTQEEEAVAVSFCTCYRHFHMDQRKTLPIFSLPWSREQRRPCHSSGSDALVLGNRTYSLRTSSTPCPFTSDFLGSPHMPLKSVLYPGELVYENKSKLPEVKERYRHIQDCTQYHLPGGGGILMDFGKTSWSLTVLGQREGLGY